MAEKEFKTHNQQLKILRDRGMIVPTNGTPKRILEKVNYYNLINGYKELFIATPATATTSERYKLGTKFSEVYALYNFDNELKSIILKRILRIEKTLKSEIAYSFSEKYGHDNYLKTSNFELLAAGTRAGRERLQGVITLISKIQSEISRQLNHDSIQHYVTQHGYVPLWVLSNILTFGTVSHFYQFMKQPDRQSISKNYSILDDELISILKVLTLCRNKCAHDEIVYKFRSRPAIHNNSIHTTLAIPVTGGGSPIYGKQDLFAVIIAIKILTKKTEFNKMITEIRDILNQLDRELNVITINDITAKMGFPSNWEDIKNI